MKSTGFAAAAAAAMLLANAAFAQAQTTVRLGHVLGTEHSWNKAATGFAEDVEAKTDGRVNIEVFPSGQLGQETEMVEGFSVGTSEAGVIGCGSFQPLVPATGVIQLPYAWPDRQTVYKALDGKLGDALAQKLEAKGVKVLAYWENGFRHVTNSQRPINEPADLEGLKIRVTPDAIRLATFEALGAEPAPLAFGELYSALQQGVFDAQENPAEIIYTYSLYEVQQYLSLTGHVYGAACLVMAQRIFEGLKPADQKAIEKAAITWRDKQREMAANNETKAIEELKKVGMEVNKVDKQPFIDAVQPVWEKYRGKFGTDIVEMVEEYR